jgi:hypothetical protein
LYALCEFPDLMLAGAVLNRIITNGSTEILPFIASKPSVDKLEGSMNQDSGSRRGTRRIWDSGSQLQRPSPYSFNDRITYCGLLTSINPLSAGVM